MRYCSAEPVDFWYNENSQGWDFRPNHVGWCNVRDTQLQWLDFLPCSGSISIKKEIYDEIYTIISRAWIDGPIRKIYRQRTWRAPVDP